EMDSNYKLSTVITGLSDPRDLVVGKVGGNKGLLLIDNNKIVVYDATGYNKIISFNISTLSWSEIEDIVMDPRDPQYFYLSDVGAGRIVKGKVGPPPFYTPTYTTLVSSGLNRPRGLLFNNKKELLVVTDDSNARVVKIDTASGKLTAVFTPGIDSLNSIVQDNEGNYFISNWDDSYLYRCDKDFKNLTKQTSYNKPAGMAVNTETDLLIVLCHFCNKMEFHKLHYVEPTMGAASCPGDSFTVNVSITAEGVGTYNSSNKFQVELSSSSGNFNNPTVIGSVTSQSKPKNIKCKMPTAANGTKYKLRIKSTSPTFYSSEVSVSVYDVPDLSTVQKNWSLCKGSTVTIGRDSAANESYHWSNGANLSDSLKSNPKFVARDTGQFNWIITATNTLYGCTSQMTVLADVNPDIQLKSLDRNVTTCKGDSLVIGVETSPYSFTWSPTVGIDNANTPNPAFFDTVGRSYQINVEDVTTGCKGSDSVTVTVNNLPQLSASTPRISLCANASIQLAVNAEIGLQFSWFPTAHLSDSTSQSSIFSSDTAGVFAYVVTATNFHGCINSVTINVDNFEVPNGVLTEVSGAGNKTEGDEVYVSGKLNNSAFAVLNLISSNGVYHVIDTLYTLPLVGQKLEAKWTDTSFVKGFMEFVSDSGCASYSDTLTMPWLSVKNVFVSDIEVYPNPTSSILHIKGGGVFMKEVTVTNLNGIVLFESKNLVPKSLHIIDLTEYPNGLYIIYLTNELGLRYQKKVVKLE
ncbi:MAG: hypothetical protein ACI8SE_001746, partial [Bacteroidia bacterium]